MILGIFQLDAHPFIQRKKKSNYLEWSKIRNEYLLWNVAKNSENHHSLNIWHLEITLEEQLENKLTNVRNNLLRYAEVEDLQRTSTRNGESPER